MQALDIVINYIECTLINIYGLNDDDIKLFLILETFLSEYDDTIFLIRGDFNIVLNVNLHKKE